MDKELLYYYIKKAGKTVNEVASELGINPKSLYNKANGKTEFSASEIRGLAKACDINGEGIIAIFFSECVE